MLSFPGARDPLLPRPFAVFNLEEKRLEVLYRRVGKGTGILARCREAETIRIFGPLGSGYRLPGSADAASMVFAGGIGFASVYLLIRRLLALGHKVSLLYGARTADELYRLDPVMRENPNLSLHVATDDGTEGYRGNVHELFLSLREQDPGILERHRSAFGCGPVSMLRAFAETLQPENVSVQVSLESRMACGYGVCQGCVVQTRQPNSEPSTAYRKVCTSGPVFPAEEVDWKAFR